MNKMPGVFSGYGNGAVAASKPRGENRNDTLLSILLEEIRLFAKMGFQFYCFSISWDHIFPNGNEQKPDEAELSFYEEAIDYCLECGMEPFIVICSFDIPEYLAVQYGDWEKRDMVEFYLKYCTTLFLRFKGKVKYYLPFSNIGRQLKCPYKELRLKKNLKEIVSHCKTAHSILLASALAVQEAHRIDPDIMMGCMLSTEMDYYDKLNDAWLRYEREREQYYFTDVLSRGYYSSYAMKLFEKNGIQFNMSTEDTVILVSNTVDFLAFSFSQHYSRNVLVPFNRMCKTENWIFQSTRTESRVFINTLYDRYQKPLFMIGNHIDKEGISFEYGREMEKTANSDGIEWIGYSSKRDMEF